MIKGSLFGAHVDLSDNRFIHFYQLVMRLEMGGPLRRKLTQLICIHHHYPVQFHGPSVPLPLVRFGRPPTLPGERPIAYINLYVGPVWAKPCFVSVLLQR